MKVKIAQDRGLIILSPTKDTSDNWLKEHIGFLPPVVPGKRLEIKYDGRSGADHSSDYSQRMGLGFKIDKDQKIELRASNNPSEKAIRKIRDAVFYGSGRLFLLGFQEVKSGHLVYACVNFCKHCQAPLCAFGECEHQICAGCRERCNHVYTRGIVHGGRAQKLGEGLFCEKCGMGKRRSKIDVILRHGNRRVEFARI